MTNRYAVKYWFEDNSHLALIPAFSAATQAASLEEARTAAQELLTTLLSNMVDDRASEVPPADPALPEGVGWEWLSPLSPS